MKRYFAVLVLASLFCGCALRQPQSAPAPLTVLDADNFKLMEKRQAIGAVLAYQDKLAWVASDTLVAGISPAAMDKLEGYVAQGSVQDGFVVFYAVQEGKAVQVARLDFKNGVISKDYTETVIEDGGLSALVLANNSANKFFDKYPEKLNISYNSYILEENGAFVSYFMPGSTNEYIVFGGCFKLTADESLNWNAEKLHKGPMAMKFANLTKSKVLMRTSSMDKLLSETDYAQFYITKDWAPTQYIQTSDYTFLLKFDESSGMMNSLMVK